MYPYIQETIIKGFSVTPSVQETDTLIEDALALYVNREKSEKVLIYATGITNEFSKDTGEFIIRYDLLDYNSDLGFRGTHLVIETMPWIKEVSLNGFSVKLSGDFGFSSGKRFLTHDAKKIARWIRDVESKLTPKELFGSDPLFSKRADALYYFHVLLYKILELLKE